MHQFDRQLVSAETVAEGTMAFHFARPEGFRFIAGNAVNVTLVDPPYQLPSDAKTRSTGSLRDLCKAHSPVTSGSASVHPPRAMRSSPRQTIEGKSAMRMRWSSTLRTPGTFSAATRAASVWSP